MYRVGGTKRELHHTEEIRNLNPTWSSFSIPIHQLTEEGNLNQPLLFECYDDGEFLGRCKVNSHSCKADHKSSVAKLFYVKEYELVNEEKLRRKLNYRRSGILEIASVQIVPKVNKERGKERPIPSKVIQMLDKLQPTNVVSLAVRAFRSERSEELQTHHHCNVCVSLTTASDTCLLLRRVDSRDEERREDIIHRTEVARGTLNPYWRPFLIPVGELGAANNWIRIDFLDAHSDEVIGTVRVRLTVDVHSSDSLATTFLHFQIRIDK